jgi:soluble lytic murein transglycosylase-like protein
LGAVSGAVFTFGFSGNPAAAQAEAPPPYPEFTFRRITVPPPGHSGPRINVQIAPAVPDAPASVSAAPDPVPGGSVDWFWSVIQPGLPAMPSRFWAAQSLLSAAPEAAALNVPRLSTLTAIAEAHGRDILAASIGTEVSPALALAVIAVESAGRAGAVSSAGAQGLMQLIPATAARFDVADPFDSAQNIAGGIAYLDWLMDEFGGDPILALAAYNAGEGAVTRAGGVPDYAETRAYVPKVVAAWMLARNLCLTPPELPSDGCVFQVMAMN